MPYAINTITISPGDGNSYAGVPVLNGQSLAPAKAIILLDATGGDDFQKDILFDPALFLPDPNSATYTPDRDNMRGWRYNLTTVTPSATQYLMAWLPGTNAENSRNGTAKITLVTSTQIEIEYDFFFIVDRNNYTQGELFQNKSRVLRASLLDPVDLSPSAPSVYNSTRYLYFLVFGRGATIADDVYLFDRSESVSVKFWGASSGSNSLGGVLSLTSQTTNQTILNISSNEDTKVELTVTSGLVASLSARAILIRTDSENSAVNFYDDIVKGQVDVTTVPGSSQLDKSIYSPSVKTTGTTSHVFSFIFNKAGLTVGDRYRIGFNVYDPATNSNLVFLSAELTVAETPPPAIYPDYVSDSVSDYYATFTGGNITAPVSTRLAYSWTFDRASYDTKIMALYGAGSYNGQLQSVNLFVTDNANGNNLYSVNGLGALLTRSDAGPNVTFKSLFRLNHGQLNSWAGKTLKVILQQVFFLPASLTGLSEDKIDIVSIEQFITVRDYENNSGSPRIVDIKLYDAANPGGDPLQSQCGYPAVIAESEANDAAPSDHYAMIDKEFFSITNIEEENPVVSTTMPQLDSALLSNCDPIYTTLLASCDIDSGSFNPALKYRYTAVRRIQ